MAPWWQKKGERQQANGFASLRETRIIFLILLFLSGTVAPAQIRIRLFTDQKPESVILSVTSGEYQLDSFNGEKIKISTGELVLISKFSGKLAVKIRNSPGFTADSILFSGQTEDVSFSLMTAGTAPVRQFYRGDLHCFPDLGTILLINTCDAEEYIAGVVRAEGGTGKSTEYLKTQAIIARTYMYKYAYRHVHDNFNLCDNTHCQAFKGITEDQAVILAAKETEGLVIIDRDSVLIMSAFHSNCGGETASAADVWLTGLPYLRKVMDPYCSGSGNAGWQTTVSRDRWIALFRDHGFAGQTEDLLQFRFMQTSRMEYYKAGSFTIPLRTLRTELDLRSTFFSVIPVEDSIILKGKGYGHGVGLCQEGAMVMSAKGFDYRKIIDFYYPGVMISEIKNAKLITKEYNVRY